MKNALCCLFTLAIFGSGVAHAEEGGGLGLFRSRLAANQTAAAAACKAFAEAEEIFHRTDYDHDGVLEYAQALRGMPLPAPEVDPATLPKPTDVESKKIAEAIKLLSSDEFETREKASAEIKALEVKPLGILKDALKTEKDAEVINRCKLLIKTIEQTLAPSSNIPSACNLLEMKQGAEDLCLIDRTFANAECRLGADPAKCTPKAGYLFRVLTQQGKDTTGGARNYLVNGNMTLGYALVAFPKEYGVTGKDIFMINNSGTIFQKDMGDKEKTEKFAKECDTFNPDKTWTVTE